MEGIFNLNKSLMINYNKKFKILKSENIYKEDQTY